MVAKKIVNFHTTETNNTYELCFYVDSATESAKIEERLCQLTGLEIWTGPGQTGTQLTLNVDYSFLNLNIYATDQVGKNVYSDLVITNATYHGTALYIPAGTLTMHGDVIDQVDINTEQDQRGLLDRFFKNKENVRGLIIPLYIYPTDVFNNDLYNSIMEIKKQYPGVPVVAIINPSSGPGTVQDGNYYRAIRRLKGSGITTIGYISTSFATRDQALVKNDLILWQRLYPDIEGIFYDEMTFSDTASEVEYYRNIGQAARDLDYNFIVTNPGAPFAHDYLDQNVADVIIGWESSIFPSTAQQEEDYADGMYEYPKERRALLVHSQGDYADSSINPLLKNFGWIWITQDTTPNPWDDFSEYYLRLLDTAKNYTTIAGEPYNDIYGSTNIESLIEVVDMSIRSSFTIRKGLYMVYGISPDVYIEANYNSTSYRIEANGAIMSAGSYIIRNTIGGAAGDVVLRRY